MKKRKISLLLVVCMVLCLCACGGGGKYKAVKTVRSQDYSIGFRNGDSTYHYIDKALRELSYNGTIDDLAAKWFGSKNAVDFPSTKDALSELGYIAPREFIIGVDLDSAPMAFTSGDGYDGFDIELAKAVCEKLGWSLKVQAIHSEKAFVELNSGNIDCAWGGVVLDRTSADYTILVTYMSDKLVLAAKGSGSSSIRGKTLYMGTSQCYLDLMEENTGISGKLGQISRIQGGAQDYLAALDRGECDLVMITDSAVDYFNSH